MIENNEEDYTRSQNGDAQLVHIGAEAVALNGFLSIPEEARGLVILAHGIEDVSLNPHQNVVAMTRALNQHGLATLQVDLFSKEEKQLNVSTHFFCENIDIMQQRIVGTAEWFLENPSTENLSIGYFGVGVVGAAAIMAAAERPDVVAAVVAVGSEADLALDYVPRVLAPILLIAGEHDTAAIETHQRVLAQLKADKQLETVEGEASLFASQHGVDEVVRLAGGWFSRWLVPIV